MTKPRAPRVTPSFHIRAALCNLLDSANDMRQAAALMKVGDREGQRLLRLSRLADSVVEALESRYRIRVQQ
jgi:hypothetical protein